MPGLRKQNKSSSGLAFVPPSQVVSFPINSMVIFHSYVNVYQRVYPIKYPIESL